MFVLPFLVRVLVGSRLQRKLVGLFGFVPTPDNRASADVRENLEPGNRSLPGPFQVRHGLFETHPQGVRSVRIGILHELPEAPDLIRQFIEGPMAFLLGNAQIKQPRWWLVHPALLPILAHHLFPDEKSDGSSGLPINVLVSTFPVFRSRVVI